ncbi:MAG: 30S ribosomal protein S13 [Candidatus Komeilibacteria bacterium]|nr:30S ribosomal protein S13 [Candidatus Komeilibacteria bacterium]
MARIANTNVPNEKRVEIGLTYIYGIGYTRSQKILKDLQISPDTRVKDLPETEIQRLRDYIDKNFKVEGDLRRDVLMNIKRLKEISSYRGTRHARGLPARGQRTKTNSRSVRGNVRRTMGSGRAKSAAKT